MSTSKQEGALSHEARLYPAPKELEAGICSFLEAGLAGGEPALVLAPGERLEALKERLGAGRVSFVDMAQLGLNPARITSALLEWIDRSHYPARIVSEPLWPGRSPAETEEVLRHEALVETALGTSPAKLLCAYREDLLPACARASLERSHERICGTDGTVRERTAEPHSVSDLLAGGRPLEPPCEPIEQLPVTGDLHQMRKQAAASRAASDLSSERRNEFVLAINEGASNALEYGKPPHALRLWRRGGEVIGEVSGGGQIEDPLVGRRRPAPSALRGRGLWMVNQLCDLVELRSHRSRTTLRMHKRCN